MTWLERHAGACRKVVNRLAFIPICLVAIFVGKIAALLERAKLLPPVEDDTYLDERPHDPEKWR
jgi:hypothetical protein